VGNPEEVLMRIVVTGGQGFIGTHLCHELHTNGHEVTSLDIKPDQQISPWRQMYGRDLLGAGPGDTSMHLDEAIRNLDPDVVVHLAAQVGRLFGEDNIEHTIESNALMTARVARSCAAAFRRPRLVYTSTSEVYGDLGPYTGWEDAVGGVPANMRLPHNLYGLSKRWGEEISALYALTEDTEGSLQVVRPSMPYGPGLPPGRGRAAIVNMLAQAYHREPIVVHRGAERSWCWIGDAVRGFRKIITDGAYAVDADEYRRGVGCYNLGRDDASVSMRTVAEMACAVVGDRDPDELIVEVDAPARQTVVKRLSTEKVQRLGWSPEVGLFEGMTKTYEAMQRLGHLPSAATGAALPGGTPIPPT
jgi:nucleoside-diphosphate-sugar epimerase